MNKKEIKEIREEITELLNKYGNKKRISFSLGTIIYDDSSFGVRLEGCKIGPESEGMVPKYILDYQKYCEFYNLKQEDLGRKIQFGKRHYKIIGLRKNYRKYPLIVEGPRGAIYKLPIDHCILEQLGRL